MGETNDQKMVRVYNAIRELLTGMDRQDIYFVMRMTNERIEQEARAEEMARYAQQTGQGLGVNKVLPY